MGSCKGNQVEVDSGRDDRCVVVIKLNRSVLKIGEIKREVLKNTRVDRGDINDELGNEWGDRYKHDQQPPILSPS